MFNAVITCTEWVEGRNAVYFQNIVKRCNGRFESNLTTEPRRQYISVSFATGDDYRKYSRLSRILDYKFF